MGRRPSGKMSLTQGFSKNNIEMLPISGFAYNLVEIT